MGVTLTRLAWLAATSLFVVVGTTAAASAPPGVFHPRTVVVSPTAAAGVKPGDSLLSVARTWGFPAEVATVRRVHRDGTVYADQVAYWRNVPGAKAFPVEVEARRGKVVSIEIVLDASGPTSRLRTPRGDRRRSTASDVKKHWPTATRVNSCCSEVFWYVLATRSRDFLFAFRLEPLDAFFLGSRRSFFCEVNECIP